MADNYKKDPNPAIDSINKAFKFKNTAAPKKMSSDEEDEQGHTRVDVSDPYGYQDAAKRSIAHAKKASEPAPKASPEPDEPEVYSSKE